MLSALDAFALVNNLYIAMPLQLADVNADADFAELVRVMMDSYEDPPSTLYKLFCPTFGSGSEAREAALKEHAQRFHEWHVSDPTSHWKKVVDTETGAIIAGALWKIHESSPFPDPDASGDAGHEDHTAYWYPAGGARNFVTHAIEQFEAPREHMGRRPQVCT